jgi:hypothetical protein
MPGGMDGAHQSIGKAWTLSMKQKILTENRLWFVAFPPMPCGMDGAHGERMSQHERSESNTSFRI